MHNNNFSYEKRNAVYPTHVHCFLCRRQRVGKVSSSTPSVATAASASTPAPAAAEPNDFGEYIQLWSGLGECLVDKDSADGLVA